MQNGKLLVIEGTDGVGKATQAAALSARMAEAGYPVQVISFPLYGEPCAAPVEELLRGDAFGPAAEVDSKQAALIFAVGMFGARRRIEAWLTAGTHVICDRYVTTNIAYQGGRVDDSQERMAFVRWLDVMHHDWFRMPRPDSVAVLQFSVEKGAALAERQDAYDRDLGLQEKAARMYARMAIADPERFHLVPCMRSGIRISPDEMTDQLWNIFLPVISKDG